MLWALRRREKVCDFGVSITNKLVSENPTFPPKSSKCKLRDAYRSVWLRLFISENSSSISETSTINLSLSVSLSLSLSLARAMV